MGAMRKNCQIRKFSCGFSLVEMAVVLVILGFVVTALILPVSAQREASFLRKTDNQLEIAQKALIGFAQANGRFPCPAMDGGIKLPGEEEVAGGECTSDPFAVGYFPAKTLGVAAGFLLDGWGRRVRYAVTKVPANVFTTPHGIAGVGLANLNPDLQVLNENNVVMIGNAVAVIYSDGANGIAQARNAETGQFYSYISTNFDDIVTWISPYVLYNAMIQARQLP